MMAFGLRFDFRNPDFARTTTADRYAAALDMAEWADRLGCMTIVVSEHHGSSDGYLPSPIPMLAAMAARTTDVRLSIGALIATLHDPIRLAEDLIFLDNLSRGRVDVIVAAGYVAEEFALFDIPMAQRGRRITEAVTTMKAAFRGEPFEHRGRTVHVTPGPHRPGGPTVLMGGSSEPAARRAARIGDGFIPSDPESWEHYRDEVQLLGRPDPGPNVMTPGPTVALAEDPDAGWAAMGPYFLHETNAYATWNTAAGLTSPYGSFADTDALRASGQYLVLTPEAFVELQRAKPFAFEIFHPMCGGMPIDLAWSSLRLFEHEVLPGAHLRTTFSGGTLTGMDDLIRRHRPTFATLAEERQHRKERLAAAFRIFSRAGFEEGVAGHITARDPEDPHRFWVNPFAVPFSQIKASDLICVDADGEVVEGRHPVNRAAFAIHSQVHLARPDVVAAAHTHSLHGKALSSLRTTLLPLTQDACAFYGQHSLFDDYTGVVLDPDEGKRIAHALGDNKAVILANHGLLTVGTTVDSAAWWFMTMERSCQAQLLATAAGTPVPIDHDMATVTNGQTGSEYAGWLSFQALYDRIVAQEPDLLD